MSEVKRWYANWSDSMDEAPETDAPNEHGTMFIKLADHDRIVSEQVKTITELQNENRRLVEGTQDDAEFAHRRRRKRLAGYRRALSRCRGKRDNLRAENAELRRRAEHAEAVAWNERQAAITARELLGKVRDAHHLPGSHCEMEDAVVEVDAFLSEMEDTHE
jgi:hypothetical protein